MNLYIISKVFSLKLAAKQIQRPCDIQLNFQKSQVPKKNVLNSELSKQQKSKKTNKQTNIYLWITAVHRCFANCAVVR